MSSHWEQGKIDRALRGETQKRIQKTEKRPGPVKRAFSRIKRMFFSLFFRVRWVLLDRKRTYARMRQLTGVDEPKRKREPIHIAVGPTITPADMHEPAPALSQRRWKDN